MLLMGKSTISTGPSSIVMIVMLVYQRVTARRNHISAIVKGQQHNLERLGHFEADGALHGRAELRFRLGRA